MQRQTCTWLSAEQVVYARKYRHCGGLSSSARTRVTVHFTHTRVRLNLIGEDDGEVELLGEFL